MSGPAGIKGWLDVLWRRRYWAIVPALLGLAAAAALLQVLPKTYRTTTTVLVADPEVSEKIAPSTVTADGGGTVLGAAVQIVGSSYLQRTAQAVGLLAPDADEARKTGVANWLRGRVFVDYDSRSRSPNWFTVTAEDQDPQRAAKIANTLVDLFLQDANSGRVRQAQATLDTARNWLREIRGRLDEKEARLAAWRQGRLWELPEQLPANMQMLTSTQGRIDSLESEIRMRQARIDQLRMQAQIAASTPGAPAVTVTAGDPAAARVAALRGELSQMLLTYTEDHPDVQAKKREIALAEQAATAAPPPATTVTGSASAPPRPAGPTVTDVEIAGIEAEIRNLREQQSKLAGETATYQGRIATAPVRQQEADQLTRDIETLQAEYRQWLANESTALRSLEMERAQRSAPFRVQDRAPVPQAPDWPKPLQILLLGTAAGLALGIGLSVVLELADTTVRTEEEFRSWFPDLPLLATIPDLAQHAAPQAPRGRRGERRAAAGA